MYIGLQSQLLSHLGHFAQTVIIDCGGQHGTVGDAFRVLAVDEFLAFGRHAPVSIHVAHHHSVMHHSLFYTLHPAPQSRVELHNGLAVGGVREEHVGGIHEGCLPCDVFGIVVEERGTDVGHQSVLPLGVFDITKPLVIECGIVQEKVLSETTGHAVAQPSQSLVALRTIQWHPLVIASDAPQGVGEEAVEECVAALE